jgi:hypothetical protein
MNSIKPTIRREVLQTALAGIAGLRSIQLLAFCDAETYHYRDANANPLPERQPAKAVWSLQDLLNPLPPKTYFAVQACSWPEVVAKLLKAPYIRTHCQIYQSDREHCQ